MARLGPFNSTPKLAIGVSGGADSMALALLAARWAAERSGSIHALIVDHGLRAESGAEAALTAKRLHTSGIEADVLKLSGLHGSGLQVKARNARLNALSAAAQAKGALHLLLGHHASDQSETIQMRAARGSSGLEGMAGWSARSKIVILRPFLKTPPQLLRDYLVSQRMGWVEDISNQDERFERVRVRHAGMFAPAASAEPRQTLEHEAAVFIATHTSLRPEGFAVIKADCAPPAALGALIRVVGGGDYPPAQANLKPLAEQLYPTTIGGARLLRSVRSNGWILVREPDYAAPPVAAVPGALWDRRFILRDPPPRPASFGALGEDAAAFRKHSALPAIVLRSMPCLRDREARIEFPVAAQFYPAAPATLHPFIALQY